MKKMKLSDYFKIVKPEYVYLKLTPTNSIRNYNSDKIAKAVASLYRGLLQRIKKHNKQYFFEVPSKVAYYIYIEKQKVEFYFIVPAAHLSLIKEKIGDTWKGITITQVDEIPIFTPQAVRYKLTYRKEDALSLAIDRRTNTLLSSMLNVIDVMEDGDRIGVFYNFIPVSQYSWRSEHDHTIKKFQDNYPIDKEKFSIGYALKMALTIAIEIINTFMEVAGSVFGENKNKKPDYNFLLMPHQPKTLLPATESKKNATIIKAQILVMAESQDKIRASNNAYSVCEAFKSVSGDNELIYKRHREKIDMNRLMLPGIDPISTSPDECQNFIALPGRELLEEHKIIEKIDTFESEVPEELQRGCICIGENTYRGKSARAYLTSDKEYKNLALVIVGPTRSGKTTLISNISNDSLKAGECTIIFDFCGNCELSTEVAANFKKVLSIECDNGSKLQGLGYNEVKNIDNDIFKVYRNAKIQTSQLLTLVNSINADDSDLKARMERYLEAAAVVVFIQSGPIRDVFAVLQDHMLRHKYISGIQDSQKENLMEYIMALEELDEWSKASKDSPAEIVGTKISFVQGILNRVNKLKQNAYLELMLKRDCTNNIDLVEEIQKPQLICIRMPEVMFSTETEKDIYCTYWITKIWLALQIRKWEVPREKHIKVNIIVDELYQIPHTQDFIRSKLSQMAKFSGKMIISCHYLGQIGIIRDELKAANSSYMLISGCDKDNYKELKDELYPYQVEDLLNLKRYHSLNLLKYEKGYARFITQLPKPI